MKQIQWFPGHMAKARRQVEEKLRMVDIIFELLDARIPFSSANPMLNDIIKNKPRLIILNKSDLSDKNELNKWLEYYKQQGIKAVTLNSLKGEGVNKIIPACKEILKEKIDKSISRGLKERPIRAMILGIPNVGKSTLINRLANRKATSIGDRPGVTKQQQYIRVGKELELLDTPGILWPKFDSEVVAFNLALTGAIKDNILPKDEVVIYGMKFLTDNYPNMMHLRYNIDVDIDNIVKIFDDIGLRRGCKISGGEIDYNKVCDVFLYDFRHQKLGNVILDKVENHV